MRDNSMGSSKDIDKAAEPFMEQAKEALGDVTDDEDLESSGKRSPRRDDRDSQAENDMA
ncbi:MAG: CsbD family protein [Actinomycetota bacterium]|nr:CsbD family protein [Actinomycetota bacterium]